MVVSEEEPRDAAALRHPEEEGAAVDRWAGAAELRRMEEEAEAALRRTAGSRS